MSIEGGQSLYRGGFNPKAFALDFADSTQLLRTLCEEYLHACTDPKCVTCVSCQMILKALLDAPCIQWEDRK